MLLVKVFQLLNKHKVRYLVAGGVATVLYGNPRFTKDLDLFVDLEEKNLRKLVEVFELLKFNPRIPVKAEEFVSQKTRERWIREKGMLAFTFINPKNPFENVDILLSSPISFQHAYRRKKMFRSEGVHIPTVSRGDLIQMKNKAGRAQDLYDVAILEAVTKSKDRKKK